MADTKDWPNSGALFRSDKKDGPKDRDYQGAADVDCPHCGARSAWWLSAWIKEGRKGKFMSLSFRAKDAAACRRPGPEQPLAEDDDIPF